MTDTPTFHVVRVPPDEQMDLAGGKAGVVVLQPGWANIEGRRALLVYLDDLPAPGEMGEAKSGAQFDCHIVSVNDTGQVRAYTFGGISLIRRAPPEPTWREDLETIRCLLIDADVSIHAAPSCAALARIEKRLAGGES